jgi:hypothetical protein
MKFQFTLAMKFIRVGVLLLLALILWQTTHSVVQAQTQAKDKPL